MLRTSGRLHPEPGSSWMLPSEPSRGGVRRRRPSIGPARSRLRLAFADLLRRPPGACRVVRLLVFPHPQHRRRDQTRQAELRERRLRSARERPLVARVDRILGTLRDHRRGRALEQSRSRRPVCEITASVQLAACTSSPMYRSIGASFRWGLLNRQLEGLRRSREAPTFATPGVTSLCADAIPL